MNKRRRHKAKRRRKAQAALSKVSAYFLFKRRQHGLSHSIGNQIIRENIYDIRVPLKIRPQGVFDSLTEEWEKILFLRGMSGKGLPNAN